MIVVLKLTTGDEIVANEIATDTYEKVRALMIEDEMRAKFVPWLIMAQNSSLTISSNHIITKIEADSELQSAYLRATTGLEIVTGV